MNHKERPKARNCTHFKQITKISHHKFFFRKSTNFYFHSTTQKMMSGRYKFFNISRFVVLYILSTVAIVCSYQPRSIFFIDFSIKSGLITWQSGMSITMKMYVVNKMLVSVYLLKFLCINSLIQPKIYKNDFPITIETVTSRTFRIFKYTELLHSLLSLCEVFFHFHFICKHHTFMVYQRLRTHFDFGR